MLDQTVPTHYGMLEQRNIIGVQVLRTILSWLAVSALLDGCYASVKRAAISRIIPRRWQAVADQHCSNNHNLIRFDARSGISILSGGSTQIFDPFWLALTSSLMK